MSSTNGRRHYVKYYILSIRIFLQFNSHRQIYVRASVAQTTLRNMPDTSSQIRAFKSIRKFFPCIRHILMISFVGNSKMALTSTWMLMAKVKLSYSRHHESKHSAQKKGSLFPDIVTKRKWEVSLTFRSLCLLMESPGTRWIGSWSPKSYSDEEENPFP